MFQPPHRLIDLWPYPGVGCAFPSRVSKQKNIPMDSTSWYVSRKPSKWMVFEKWFPLKKKKQGQIPYETALSAAMHVESPRCLWKAMCRHSLWIRAILGRCIPGQFVGTRAMKTLKWRVFRVSLGSNLVPCLVSILVEECWITKK